MNLAEVAVALPVHSLYTYQVPSSLKEAVAVGKRVLAPFGRRQITGYILDFPESAPEVKIKPISQILDQEPLFPENMIPFFRWMAHYYKYPIGEVIKTAAPGGLNQYEFKTVKITEKGLEALEKNLPSPAEKKVLGFLKDRKDWVFLKNLRDLERSKRDHTLALKMVNRGWVEVRKELRGGQTRHLWVKYFSLAGKKDTGAFKKAGPVKEKLLRAIEKHEELSVSDLKKITHYASKHVKELEKSGFLVSSLKKEYRDPLGLPIPKDTPPDLNREQKDVVARVLRKVQDGFQAFLLAGVTGSGKTEVYLHLAAEIIKLGKSVLVLTPEIALISQMVRRFRARFGDSLSIMHSGLSDGERLDQWERINSGRVDIAVGARSAIFAPFENLGLIIVDEEHDSSYKQESHFRYNARDLAVMRARQTGCTVLLGSATPSVQSFFNVGAGKFQELRLTKRIENRPLAEISVVDLRAVRSAKGYRRFISPELVNTMKETLEKKEQVLLFLNRRGFASHPLCADCGKALRCKNCEITLTLHKSVNSFQCHFCGYSIAAVSACPGCGSSKIMHLGLGTEKVEATIKSIFPHAVTARMDRDSTRRKGSHGKILRELRNGDIDILIGTQMVAKGHDFPNITLVGVICADLSLGFPDFRAGERTFQLLAQVAGRAGRGNAPGKVILQTFNPNHFSILAAKEQDFQRFYNHEILFRKTLSYPPYSRLVQLAISGRNKQKTRKFSENFGIFLSELKRRDPVFTRHNEILGPIEAPLARLDNQFRWQILIKGLKTSALHAFINKLVYENGEWFNNRDVKVVVDVDPYMML